MDCNSQGELELDCAFDLESGRTTERSLEPLSSSKLVKTFFIKFCLGLVNFDRTNTGENGVISTEKKVEREEGLHILENKMGKEKSKKTSAKKPPRPPRGLSLDAADQKLIKEIAELAMMKRARADRVKALKKMKAAKASSSNGNLFAMIFTTLFCLAILFQGFWFRIRGLREAEQLDEMKWK